MKQFYAPGFPKSTHPAIPDALSLLEGVPGYNRQVVQNTSIGLIGAGGLGSWIGTGIVRSGLCQALYVVDPDVYDLSNAGRQLVYTSDIGSPKAFALSKNLAPHAVRPMTITGLALPFEEAVKQHTLCVDLVIFGVDNNPCRLSGALFARSMRIPAIFSMLSTDGTRAESFWQGAREDEPCLHCCYPELDPNRTVACAFASTTICFLASSFTLFFTERALMGWDEKSSPFNFRSADLRNHTPEHTGMVLQRPNCPTCGRFVKEGHKSP